MKYLKHTLLEQSRSLDDGAAEAACDEWDRAIAHYNTALAAIRPQFPAAVRTILDRFSLHDAKVLKMLEMKYTVAKGGLRIVKRGKDKEWPKDGGRIQYDEFGKAANTPEAVFTHFILLSGGCELRIWFTDLRLRTLKKVMFPSVEQAGLGTP
jgi:hypothetical protein